MHFAADQKPALAKTANGKEVTVSGELGEVWFTNNQPEGLALQVDVRHSKIEDR